MNDELGDQIKAWENSAYPVLFGNDPVCLRLDGRAFHTFTKGLARPFDERLSNLMVETMKFLVKDSGASLGYTQSDEITLIIHPNKLGELPFGGRKSKLESIYAALCSSYFNLNLAAYIPEKFVLPDEGELPVFDCRAFNVPAPYDAEVIRWRQQDCSRNSINMLARTVFSHADINGVSTNGLKLMLLQKGVDWTKQPNFFKYGTFAKPVEIRRKLTKQELANLPLKHEARKNPSLEVVRRTIDTYSINLYAVKNLHDVLFNGESPELPPCMVKNA